MVVGLVSLVTELADSVGHSGNTGPASVKRVVVHVTTVHRADDVRIMEKECKSLASMGYSVLLVAPAHDSHVDAGVRVLGITGAQNRAARMTKTVLDVYRRLVTIEADVYHFHDPELLPVALIFAARGKKVVLDLHEDLPRQVMSKGWILRPVRPLIAWLASRAEAYAFRRVSAVIAATPSISERCNNAVVIQNFPRMAEACPVATDYESRPNRVIYHGGISAIRSAHEMVVSLKLIPEELGVELVLAGQFYPTELREELSKIPGWSRVRFLGWLSRDALFEAMGATRAGLVLCQPEPNYIRSQPNKLFEYMAAGLPVIASDFPLWREIVAGNRCGILVDPGRPEEIAKAIEWIMKNPSEAVLMGQRGRQAVLSTYNWESEERKLRALYDSLTASPASTHSGDMG